MEMGLHAKNHELEFHESKLENIFGYFYLRDFIV